MTSKTARMWMQYALRCNDEQLDAMQLTAAQIDQIGSLLADNALLNPPNKTVKHYGVIICHRCRNKFMAEWTTKRPIYCTRCR